MAIHVEFMLWSGSSIVPGHMEDVYLGRSELWHINSSMVVLHYISHFLVTYTSPDPAITMLCNSQSALNHITPGNKPNTSSLERQSKTTTMFTMKFCILSSAYNPLTFGSFMLKDIKTERRNNDYHCKCSSTSSVVHGLMLIYKLHMPDHLNPIQPLVTHTYGYMASTLYMTYRKTSDMLPQHPITVITCIRNTVGPDKTAKTSTGWHSNIPSDA